MAKVLNNTLDRLFSELRFAPRDRKVQELEAMEGLLGLIEADRDYPLEFICYKITDYRLRDAPTDVTVNGFELCHDLRAFIGKLSGELGLSAFEQGEKVHTIDELAESLGVSVKTIYRWRVRGLMGRRYVFGKDNKQLGFLQSSVDDFSRRNPVLFERAKKFSQLRVDQKRKIVEIARSKARKSDLSRYQIIKRIAFETCRSHETIRSILIDHEKRHHDDKIFDKPSGTIGPREASLVYKLRKQGVSIKELMLRFHRSRSSIHRIITNRRAKALLAQRIEYVSSDEFIEDGVMETILGKDGCQERQGSVPGGLLNREQEVELFRRYNYLKHLACLTRVKINRVRPCSRRLKKVEDYLGLAEAVKTTIIESNLGLVVSVANKHLGSGGSMQDLVSEGNLSLMRAVEKFDYTRGYRFSTYATWAVAKDFARKIPAEEYRPDRAGTGDMLSFQEDMRSVDAADIEAIERAHLSLDEVIENNLDKREQYIIRSHYGLDSSIVKRKPKTLKEIGEKLGLSRERVRQVELIALQKLRHSLSPEEFDLLTG